MAREPHRREAEALDRYWDAVLSGHLADAPVAVGEEQAAVIQPVQALGAAPGQEAVRARIWDALTRQPGLPREDLAWERPRLLLPISDSSSGAREFLASRRRFAASRRSRWLMTHVATAALLVLTLAAGLLAAGPWRDARPEPMPSRQLSAIAMETPLAAGPIVEFLWQSDGGLNFRLGTPTGAAVDPHGNLWVTDGVKDRILMFAPEGEGVFSPGGVLEVWDGGDSGEGKFNFKCSSLRYGGIAFDPADNIYVADSGNQRVLKFSPDRTFLVSLGSEGIEDGQFLCPNAVAVDRQGRVCVSDQYIGKIEVFAADGEPLATWDAPNSPGSVAVDGQGDIWVTDATSAVMHFSPDGALLTKWDNFGSEEGQINGPLGIAIDAKGRVFVSDLSHRVQVFSPDGAFLGSWGSEGYDAGQFYIPFALALDGQGHIYVTDDVQRVQKFRLLPPLGRG